MAEVLVCVKRVPQATTEPVITADGLGIDATMTGSTMSPHEECAVELATQIADATGGSATVLTLGGAESVDQLRDALSVGVTAAVHIEADPAAFGPADVARAIADVVRAKAATGAPYDVVLLGNDAADTGDFQVGVRVAYSLDWPVVAGCSTVAVDGTVASCVADGPEGTGVFEVALPVVATVLEGGVEPRYPSLMGRMKAKKVAIETVAPGFTPVGSGRVGLALPPPIPNEVEILGQGVSAAPAVVAVLKELGVVR